VSQGRRFSILFSPAVTADVHHYQSEWDGAVNDLRLWALQKDVPIIDMTQSVAAGDAALLYFDGIHLRPAGDRLFADIFVKQYGEIPSQFAHNALLLPRTEVTSPSDGPIRRNRRTVGDVHRHNRELRARNRKYVG
jgi:hypothetical protein